MDQQGDMIRQILGRDPKVTPAAADASAFVAQNGLPQESPQALGEYGYAMADYLRKQGHNVNVFDNR